MSTYVYSEHQGSLKKLLSGKELYVIADESTDACQRSVLVTLAVPAGQGQSYVIGVDFLDRVNNSTVSQVVIRSLNEFGFSLDGVLAIVSDSARYMIKAYNTILGGLMPNSVHVLCLQ